MKASALKIWNESNHAKVVPNKKTALTLLSPRTFDLIDGTMNESDEL